ncbi:hypothetical protein AB1L42_17545 [Thalassoglobus sp. JC818]|uniref:hypothetical protein n=1 Tax=Thalassoglobus sp. JC818 TaxID=3232136 RepID=UPI00345A7CF7
MNSITVRSGGSDRQRSKYVHRHLVSGPGCVGASGAVLRGQFEFSGMRVQSSAFRFSSPKILLHSIQPIFAKTLVVPLRDESLATPSRQVAKRTNSKCFGGLSRDEIIERNTGSTQIDQSDEKVSVVVHRQETASW